MEEGKKEDKIKTLESELKTFQTIDGILRRQVKELWDCLHSRDEQLREKFEQIAEKEKVFEERDMQLKNIRNFLQYLRYKRPGTIEEVKKLRASSFNLSYWPSNWIIKVILDFFEERAKELELEMNQLAEKEKEIEKLKEQEITWIKSFETCQECKRVLQEEYNHCKKWREDLINAVEKAVIAIWNTKSIFGKFSPKSGTLARIREDLMKVLPTETIIRLCGQFGFGPPNPIPKSHPPFPLNKPAASQY